MSDLSTPPGRLRVGDAERERVADLLAEHHAAGRLTLPELDERLTAIWSARTRDELAAPLADLPVRPAPVEGRPSTASGHNKTSAAEIGWRVHLYSYLAVVAGLWLIWALTGAGYPWPIWTMFGWGLGLLGHRGRMSLRG
jgi:hypothetical protein